MIAVSTAVRPGSAFDAIPDSVNTGSGGRAARHRTASAPALRRRAAAWSGRPAGVAAGAREPNTNGLRPRLGLRRLLVQCSPQSFGVRRGARRAPRRADEAADAPSRRCGSACVSDAPRPAGASARPPCQATGRGVSVTVHYSMQPIGYAISGRRRARRRSPGHRNPVWYDFVVHPNSVERLPFTLTESSVLAVIPARFQLHPTPRKNSR